MNNNLEDQLFEVNYEYKGEENYTPARSFLKKIHTVLILQISITLFAHILFGGSLNSTIHKLLTFSFINFWTILFALVTLSTMQNYFARQHERNQNNYLIALILRTFLLYFILRLLVPPEYLKEIILFISLILSLHVILLGFAYRMRGTFDHRKAVLWILVWALVMGFLLKPVLIRNSVDNLGMFICVLLVFLYGLYLIFETNFILDGIVFETSYHEVLFAAFTLQFDVTGALIWWAEKYVRIRRNYENFA